VREEKVNKRPLKFNIHNYRFHNSRPIDGLAVGRDEFTAMEKKRRVWEQNSPNKLITKTVENRENIEETIKKSAETP
jgi:hypothetical protein